MRTKKVKQKPEQTGSEKLSEIIESNVATIANIEKTAHDARTRVDRIADQIAAFCGSIVFLWVHCAWFGVWLAINSLPMFRKSIRFDPPPFGVLTLIVSLEAIFLSTFIMISQNRQQKVADQRNQLDLQINLLAEQEASEIIAMLGKIMDFHGISLPDDKGHALKTTTDATKLAESIENKIPEGE